ncbi:PhzF family phenazine biosynthesis protein [Streptacidiphilus jiangxiensis]|uniref:Phenazine biosynthesis protein PhzF family n=1 Tax=Streptacidiphilus jiangxiensis TaxID=235985 RepID=A0A1H7U7C5_STRJI|nr:PhzF family phenazine biosynthesis protein [Streptacidiphilus jiangxiensis]SEL92636.1 phenazine biosynthesis protein PhzF family [Streptacidiphilus jiangxiensis]
MTDLHVLRVFSGPGGTAGNALGVVLEGGAFPGREERQELARELGFSETVFVDDAGSGRVDIYTPSARLLFAGHPLVGTSWLLRREGLAVELLRPEAGDVPAWQEEDIHWIRGRAEWAAGRKTRRYGSVAEVDALDVPPPGTGWLYAWAWSDEASGSVRTRGFPGRGDGVDEDEATGAAAVVLTAELGRALDIRQGAGSQILTRVGPAGTVEVGGRVVPQELRKL